MCRLGCSQYKAGKNISIFGTRLLIFNLEIDGSIGKCESFSVVKEGNNADLLLSKCQVAVHQGLLLCEMPCLPIDKQKRVLCSCSQCNGIKLTPARFVSDTGSRRKNWKLIVKVKGTDIKLDDLTQCDGCEIRVHTECIKTYTEEELKNIKYFCPACMTKGKMKATTVIPSAIDETRCQVAVHQECYGARDVNDLTSWVCRACEEPQVKRHCCLCPIKGGTLKKTDVGDFWVHVTCTWFQPKMAFLDPDDMEPAVGVLSVPLDSFKKKRVICEQVHGACTKCCKCNVYYHAICASRAGYRMELHTYVSHGKQISHFDSYCLNHGDVNKSNALVLCTEEIVFSSMRYQRNNVRPSCSRLRGLSGGTLRTKARPDRFTIDKF